MSNDYYPAYPVALKADRILDLLLSEDGTLQVDQRTRGAALQWTGLANPPTLKLNPGDSIDFTLAVPEGSEALFAIQARDWPSGYIPPKLIVLGRLDPMGGNGVEVLTANNPLTFKTVEISGRFTADGKIVTTLYRFKKAADGTITRDPTPGLTTTVDLAAYRDGPVPGVVHAVLRLPPGVSGSLKLSRAIAGQTEWIAK